MRSDSEVCSDKCLGRVESVFEAGERGGPEGPYLDLFGASWRTITMRLAKPDQAQLAHYLFL